MDPLLQRLRDAAAQTSAAAFARQYPLPALVLYIPVDDWMGFNTTVRSTQEIIDSGPDAIDDEFEFTMAVRWVEKSDRNPYADRISLGRSGTCDIVVRQPSVSKLHAHFVRSDGGGWAIRDANSRNGVAVNKVRIDVNRPAPLKWGDTITFGTVDARFVDAQALYGIVRRVVGNR